MKPFVHRRVATVVLYLILFRIWWNRIKSCSLNSRVIVLNRSSKISLDSLFVLVLVLVVLVLLLVSFGWFRFVVSGFSSGQTQSEQMNKVYQIRLFRRYSGYFYQDTSSYIMLHVYYPFSVLSNCSSWNDLANSSVFKCFQLSVCGLWSTV